MDARGVLELRVPLRYFGSAAPAKLSVGLKASRPTGGPVPLDASGGAWKPSGRAGKGEDNVFRPTSDPTIEDLMPFQLWSKMGLYFSSSSTGAADLAESVTASGASRNDPCPCGSGRKLKKCCGVSGPAARSPDRLAGEIAAFALRATDAAGLQAAWEEHGETGSVRSDARRFGIFMDWLIAGRRRGCRTLLERFEAERGATLSEEERRTLEVHKATRIGVYEVVAARPGTGLRLKDLFSGEEAEIGDVSSSCQAVVHDVIAARVRWTDAPPTLWGEAVVFGPLERAELKFDLEAAYAQAKAREPELSWHAFLNSAPPLIRRLQAEYRSRRTVSVGVGPTVPLRTAADATRLLAAEALERQERWPDKPVPALGGRTPREAARAPDGRGFLLDLLKEYERNQARVPVAAGVAGLVNVPAIVWMRRALGLPVTEELSAAAERLKKAAGTQDD